MKAGEEKENRSKGKRKEGEEEDIFKVRDVQRGIK